jgi:uncharacterized protein YjbI with pentapeptide repeats
MSNSIVIRKNSGNSLTIAKSGSVSTTLVPATNATLGGVIVGDNLTITGNGVLSVANTFQPKLANTTYGLTDTGIPYIPGYTDYYIRGEYVADGLKRYYIGLRGEKETGTGTYYDPDNYAIGSYLYNSNGTLQSATSVETDGLNLSLVSSNTQGFSTVVSAPGFASIIASNATSQSVLSLGGGVISGNAQGGHFRLRGNLGGTGDNSQDYQLVFGPNSSFDRGISFQQVALKSTIGFQYIYTASSIDYNMTNGLVFDNRPSLGGFSGNPGSHTSFQHTTDAVISGVRTGTEIRASRNKAELFYLNISPVYTSNSILTQGYADTRYQAVGAYLTSANLTYANLTGKPTTLAGYGITDGLTSANLTPYLTISSANATYSVLGHTHSIANVTGLQTALDAKLETANFTYANLTGTPNLTLYLTTANASTTYQPLGNYATTSCLTFANITGKPTTLSGYGITDGYSTSNPSGYITAGANTFTGAQNLQDNELIRAKLRDYSESVSSPTISSGTLTLNLETSNIFTVSLNAAITAITISNPPASGSGGSFTLIFTADGTARAVTWPSSIKWAGGTAPTLTSTSGKADSFAFFSSDGGTSWQGYVGGQNF